jgi:hypothetical protein
VGGASGSHLSPLIAEESIFPPPMPKNFSYPRVKDSSSVSSLHSISPMQIDPPNLPLSPPVDPTSPIVGLALDFGTDNDAHRMQPCVYPRVEDTCTIEHCPDGDAAMEEAPLIAGMAESENATEIECALRNASIGGCKDALPALRSSNDDEDEGGEEHEGDARRSNDLSFGGVGSVGGMSPIQTSWTIPDRAMRGSLLRWWVKRRFTPWLTMLILTRMPCAMIQMWDFMPFFLRSLRVSTPTFRTTRYDLFHLLIQFQIGFVPSG